MKKAYVFIDSQGQEPIDRSQIKDGDVVAFVSKYGRGVALMMDSDWFYSAYNLFKPDSVWVSDNMLQDIQLLSPTKEDMILAIDNLCIIGEDEHSEAVNLWPDSIRGMDTSVRMAIEHVKNVIDDQYEVQNHIVKRWKERLEEEVKMKVEWEKETEEHCEYIEELENIVKERDARIVELENQIEQIKKVPSEDTFVKRLLKETKKMFNHERSKAVGISQLLDKMGRSDDFEDLDAWIEGREKPAIRHPQSVTVNGTVVLNNETNIDKNYGPNIDNHDGGTISLPERIIDNKGN